MSTLTAPISFGVPRARPVHRIVSTDIRAVPRQSTVALDAPEGRRITCVLGCVWITHDGEPRDIVLEPGQSYRSDSGARVLVYGLQRSSIALS